MWVPGFDKECVELKNSYFWFGCINFDPSKLSIMIPYSEVISQLSTFLTVKITAFALWWSGILERSYITEKIVFHDISEVNSDISVVKTTSDMF